ncbi:hypothetical protein BDEG_26218 [Batrachochytrium dendrobatidis JEL423]|uniref:LIM zinc-binding domain-containing protein n=1 Tax=Batrachochytrium dendrobatidis (strain JEL423) TaxID=403673 RepID=A0A177WRQ3_BATDL|nr:hypothetical protein BDEG_26218 [Batrachochytrium dendrobatidis JEL423]
MDRLSADDKVFHKTCLRCGHCSKVLSTVVGYVLHAFLLKIDGFDRRNVHHGYNQTTVLNWNPHLAQPHYTITEFETKFIRYNPVIGLDCSDVVKTCTHPFLFMFYCKPHFKQLFALKGNYSDGFKASEGTNSSPPGTPDSSSRPRPMTWHPSRGQSQDSSSPASANKAANVVQSSADNSPTIPEVTEALPAVSENTQTQPQPSTGLPTAAETLAASGSSVTDVAKRLEALSCENSTETANLSTPEAILSRSSSQLVLIKEDELNSLKREVEVKERELETLRALVCSKESDLQKLKQAT